MIGIQAGRRASRGEADVSGAFGSPAAIGELFLTDHLLAFEVTSVVLLVAAVGGVILGSHARRATNEREARRSGTVHSAPGQ